MHEILGYSLSEQIHASARSIVYRGRREADGAGVIIKVPAGKHVSADERTRFRREYEVGQLLQGDGAPAVLAFEPWRDREAIVMEDFGGLSLAALRLGTLGAREVLRLGARLAGALAAIHRRRVVHKDVSPANIVLNPATGDLRLIDFGLSTVLPRGRTAVPGGGALEGTLRYLSPEQTGRTNRAVDPRADLYSTGAVLYELLTGRPPFTAEEPLSLVHLHLAETPVAPSDLDPGIPASVSAVVMKLLAKDAEDRYQSSAGLAADLELCLGALASGAPFSPGQADVPAELRIPQKLYGREVEVRVLVDAFERAAGGRAELLLLGGYSGVGKTTLVNELYRPVVARRGHYVSGKFDQLRRDVPYAPLIQAFSELIRQILTEPEARLAAWGARLRAALGAAGQVIVDVIPHVARVIGAQPPVVDLSPGEAQNRFSFAMRQFVQALAGPEHPLAIFLDDLQWADLPSLQLLQQILADRTMENVLVVGAYRDNEVGGAHPLLAAIEGLEKSGAPVTRLALAPLDVAHVEQLAADALRCSASRAAPLARLLFERSGGNPFFVNQLLTFLHDEGLLEIDPATRSWRWDLDAIRARGLTADVVELMAGKIQRLPARAREVLELAACIGNQLDLATLAIAHGRSPAETAADLREAVDEGLLLSLDGGGLAADVRPEMRLRFLHDRVQQAAYSLIAPGERRRIHLEVGRQLLRRHSAGELEERLFEVVNQLDMGAELITAPAERLEVARLDLRAGQKAMASAASEPARHYFHAGLSLLPEDAWAAEYELCFALHAEAMEAEYLTAHVERAEALSELLLGKARDVLDKVKVYETRIAFNVTRNAVMEAIDNGYQAMALLGVDLPRQVDLPTFFAILAETKRAIGDRRARDLLALPAMTAPRWLAAMRVSVLLAAPAYVTNALLALAIVLRCIELSLPHGNAPESPYLYAAYGLVNSGILGDFDTATEFGEMALALNDGDRQRRMRSRVAFLVGLFIRHWKAHARQTFPLLEESVREGIEGGDLEYMGYSALNVAIVQLLVGEPLDVVLRECTRSLELSNRFSNGYLRDNIAPVLQAVRNLTAPKPPSSSPLRLVGPAFDEDTGIPALLAANLRSFVSLVYVLKTMLACYFRDPAAAVAVAEIEEPYLPENTGQFLVVAQVFHQAMALLGHAGAVAEDERARAVARASVNLEQLRRWAAAAPMNVLHKVHLVEAELARLRGDDIGALRLYAEAAEGARTHRWVHEQALAHELEGELLLARGLPRMARQSFTAALHGYQRWGAQAKVADLELRHAALLDRGELAPVPVARAAETAETVSISTSAQSPHAALDLPAVLRAAQAISGEIILDRLLDKLMEIAVENAGAQRGLFILPREDAEGRFTIAAERAAPGTPATRLPAPVEDGDAPLVSPAIVHYAARTGESLVLADAAGEGLFTSDPYVARRRSRSVLCAPLLNGSRLVAVLYLENDLAAGAFTEERLQVLRLLSAQAALSIHNAVLYARLDEHSRTLEQRVEERTRELSAKNEELGRALLQLREAQQQLVMAEKLASLGALTAGIAHEIKNPLNFVSNFAQVSAELSSDIAARLAPERAALDPEAREEVDEMLASLRETSLKIDEHGRRAARIIDGMLMHARRSAGQREAADLNAVVSRSLGLACDAERGKDPGFAMVVEAIYDPAVGLVEMIPADVGRVVINVVSNAYHALRSRAKVAGSGYAPTLRVRTRDGGDRAEIRVRDNGIGIPADIRDRLFNPFFTTKPAGEGTGLGLSIGHDIIAGEHQGEIRVDSTEGEFAEFVITLPKRAAPTR